MAHICTLGEVYTSLSLITLIPCGDRKHYTTECIIPDEHYTGFPQLLENLEKW